MKIAYLREEPKGTQLETERRKRKGRRFPFALQFQACVWLLEIIWFLHTLLQCILFFVQVVVDALASLKPQGLLKVGDSEMNCGMKMQTCSCNALQG